MSEQKTNGAETPAEQPPPGMTVEVLTEPPPPPSRVMPTLAADEVELLSDLFRNARPNDPPGRPRLTFAADLSGVVYRLRCKLGLEEPAK